MLVPRGPFAFARSLDVLRNFPPLRRHGESADDIVRIAFPLDGDFTPVAVALDWDGRALRCRSTGTYQIDSVRKQVARIFSLDHDAHEYPGVGQRDPAVGALMERLWGLRPVCFTSPYEAAAWAVLSQRIAATQAARIVERLVVSHGDRLAIAGGEAHAFPSPERLLRIRTIDGVAAVKVDRLKRVAEAALDGALDARRLRALGDERGPASLRTIPGIGPFWSNGIYLRACGIADAFPDEPIAIAALGALHGLGDRPAPSVVQELTDRYRPFRMWTSFLLRVAAARGMIDGVQGRESGIRRAAPRAHV